MAPRVSVIMPVCNGERYLRAALDSITSQTFTEFEFLIIDDGSSDGTWPILKDYAARDARLVLVRNEANIGLAASLNRGLKLAQGEYIARQDADDISLPERLATLVAFLDNHTEIGVVGCNAHVIDAQGTPTRSTKMPTLHGFILWSLCFHSPFVHSSVVFRREVIERVGGYDESLLVGQDRDLWQRLSSITRFANLPDVLMLYRRHPGGSSGVHSDLQAYNSARAGQRMMAQILGHEVPLDVCQNFRLGKFETPGDAIQAMRLVNSLYNSFMGKISLSGQEKYLIRKDAARRLVSLALRFRHQARMQREYANLLFYANPLLVLAMVKKLAHRGARRIG